MRSVIPLNVKSLTLLLLLVVTLPFFFIGGPDWLSSPLYRASWNLGHFAFFALLLLLIQVRWPLVRWQQWLHVGWLVLLIGGCIEWLQAYVGRDGTWSDVLHNLIGASLGLFWGQKANPGVWFGRILSSLALVPSIALTLQLALVQYESAQQFPQLAGFETGRELSRWKGNIARTDERASEGRYALKIAFGTEKYSGFSFNHFLGNWKGYTAFSFDIFNPDAQPLQIVLRIHDEDHDRADSAYADRFNTRLMVQPGWNYFSIALTEVEQAPAQRQMNLQQLRAVGIFTLSLPQPRILYLDNVRLE